VAKRVARAEPPALPEEQKNVVFEYIKSPLFRVIHADGAIGGLTPAGNVHFALYSERSAIPQMTVHPHRPDGTVGPPGQTVARPGIVREMDVDVVISPNFIPAFIEWLQQVEQQAKAQAEAIKQVKENANDKRHH
jgi:hypothetical protein